MTEIDRYRNALMDKQELLETKFKMREALDKEIAELKVDIMRMQKKIKL